MPTVPDIYMYENILFALRTDRHKYAAEKDVPSPAATVIVLRAAPSAPRDQLSSSADFSFFLHLII